MTELDVRPETRPAQRRGDPSAPARDCTFNPHFVSRSGGLPYDVVSGLASPRAQAWAREVLATESRLAAAGERIGLLLEAAIGGNPDHTNRQALLKLRRDVHNQRLPRDPEAALEAVAVHGAELQAAVGRWLTDCADLHEAVSRGDAQLAEDVTEARQHLLDLAETEVFRQGLTLASPLLDARLGDYAHSVSSGRETKRSRKQARSLLHYVYRTACKTSPFSTLTTVAHGRLSEETQELIAGSGDLSRVVGSTRLNVAVVPRVVEALRAHPDHSQDLPLELVTGWEVRSERLRYLRRRRVTSRADAGAVNLDSMQENVFYLAAGQLLAQLIEVLTAAPGTTLGQVAEAMHERLEGASREDIDRFLTSVVRLDLVTTPQLQVDLHADDPIRAFTTGLRGIGRPWADDVAGRLDRVSGLVERFAGACAHDRRDLLRDTRAELEELMTSLGAPDGSVPQTLIYEDATPEGHEVLAARSRWEQDLAPALGRVASILPVFDALAPQRYLLNGFFTVRFGRGGVCYDLVKLVQDFHLDIFDEFMKTTSGPPLTDDDGLPAPPPNWLDLEEVDALHRARLALIRGMRRAFSALEDVHQELVLTDEFFDDIVAELPVGSGDPDPRSFFAQFSGGERPGVVLNKSYTGLSLMFSRFLHALAQDEQPGSGLVEDLRAHLLEQQPDGAVFAEITGGVDTTNLNLHPAVTPYEIVCPGEVTSRSEAHRIYVSDLEVRHDPDTEELVLFCPRLGQRVIPVYLGFLLPFALSDIQRVLLLFSLNKMAQLDLWSGTDAPLGEQVISSHPRVRYGDVVLVRETWKANPAKLPHRRDFDSAARWYLEWQRFRAEHGLPRYVFATLSAGAAEEPDDQPDSPEQTRPGTDGATMSASRGKPQYVDFTSESCLQLLDDMLRQDTARIVFNEMLPGPDALWLTTEHGSYVSEQTFELIITEGSRS
ncbi:lantibiotic dehydratase family protein [Ornithinimicrobium sp. F0845]|uniref:lantibiotic dehydratase n=1 Tax=Ornithinimicrobium sp. F0845 TaxID=2926412 RepID=UPI001FF5B13F|nr:lantibiotic dehydratase [Ornithinimicrobium sp. F0845]MCK0112065.1 lantibiotic dehydratase family protein [Ornithinimicrobium sp. F0845]